VKNLSFNPITNTIKDPNVLDFLWHMKKKGLSDKTLKNRAYYMNRLLKLGANLNNPESVEIILVTNNLTPSTKKVLIDSYKAYTKFKNIQWTKPKCQVNPKEPFLPSNEEVKQLIGGLSHRLATLCKLLEETGARIGELNKVEWLDIDFHARTIQINHPEKYSNPRTLKLSKNAIAMLQSMKKREDNYIFNPRTNTLDCTFRRARNKIAKKLENPRLKKIHFHTFRHLKATGEYHKTHDLKHVQYILGHKYSSSTDRYTHYTPFEEDEYITKVAKTPEEACKLAEVGFTKFDEFDEIRLYKKRK
jgi:integrase